MNILDKIVKDKIAFLESEKKKVALAELKDTANYSRQKNSLVDKLAKHPPGIISEFKRRSPSKQDINIEAKVEEIIPAYTDGGASAISVLTDEGYFKGKSSDLRTARTLTDVPLLRKDFIVDPFQVHEAKALGADLILLIAYCLDKSESEALCDLAHELNMEVLFEIHDLHELDKMPSNIDLLGVNNRDLTSFTVDYKYAIKVFDQLPTAYPKISESGILSEESYKLTIEKGYKACLVGEFLMKENDPAKTIRSLRQIPRL